MIVSAILYTAGFFSFSENKTYDMRMQFAAKYKLPCDDIALIVVDQKSIDWAQENYGWAWPWPRQVYADIVNFLSGGKPESIAFDIIFSEPSLYGENDDFAFALAEQKSGCVIQTAYCTDLDNKEAQKDDICKMLEPVEIIRQNAAMLGNITSSMDDDDVIRRSIIGSQINGRFYPSLGMAGLYMHGNQPDVSNIPLQSDGTVYLRYQKSLNDYFPYSAKDILSSYYDMQAGRKPLFSPEDFDDLYIFIAYYAPGIFDICSTPVSQVFPGVGVHITTLDNFLTNSFIKKLPDTINCLWIFTATILASLTIAFAFLGNSTRKMAVCLTLGITAGLAILIGLPYILFIQNYWLILTAPLFAYLLTLIVNISFKLSVEGKQKRFIKTAFSQCLSKEVVNQIINDPSSFTLGGKSYEMTAIFTDIRKFSSFSELLSPPQLGSLLNYYFTVMSEIIIQEHGTIDKYEGDAIVALVGAPVKMNDHAQRACRAAIKMKLAEKSMNDFIEQTAAGTKPANMEQDLYDAFTLMIKNEKSIFTRIGINSGEMIAGYFGSENKKNYTMMGNNVNLASRLEGVNKHYNTGGIIISEFTYQYLQKNYDNTGRTSKMPSSKMPSSTMPFIVRKLDRVQVVNIQTPVQLYELIIDENLSDYINRWNKAKDAFDKKEYNQAYQQFSLIFEECPDDGVTQYYINLLEKYFLKGTYPLEKNNEGIVYLPEENIFRLTQK